MRSTSHYLLLAVLATWAATANAQLVPAESLGPIHARPLEGSTPGEQRSLVNEYFIYEYLPQILPLEDDFSTDRTRHLDAQSGQGGVTLTDTYYHLEVGGVSTADMTFVLEPTFRYTFDISDPDTVIKDTIPLASTMVTVYDLNVYPPASSVVEAWPPYDIDDTLNVYVDTTFIVPADLVQDSLFVYNVAADTRTYEQGLTQVPLILWQDDYAYVNRTYPVDPPTIGVATFDGLDRTGFPYDVTVPLPYGECDKLTSVPINLQFPPGDSLYLSFLYQPQGLSGDDVVQVQDSLIVELFAPDDNEWVQVWQSDYSAVQPFQQVMLPITDARFLKPDFQMRWRNFGTRSGALDQWHIDYVRLGRNRSFDDTVLVDVAFVMPESSLLQTYTSVPFAKFSALPASYMAQSVELTMKNLDIDDKFITWGYDSGIDGTGPPFETCVNYGNNISNNAETTFQSTHPVNSGTCSFVYDPSLSTDAAFWRTTYWLNATPNNIPYNDTLSFVQEISNYYSYDDGSAEAGYSLNTAGAKAAVRFDTQGGDSLRAVRMYFDPIFSENDPTDGSFLLTVWSSLNPEVIVFQNFSYGEPNYRLDGPNKFVEFPLDSTIFVQGTFYVGWVQTNAIKMNVGFDKNRDNSDKIFYKVSGPFTQTSYEGSLMLRPVMVSAVDPWASVPEVSVTDQLVVYPNPAGEEVFIKLDNADGAATVELLDLLGQVVERTSFRASTPMSVVGLVPGMYVVRVLDREGVILGQERIIVQH
ncbi:MAG: T9SS type A sorting domain-containing protein [Flavobacteriales bacterium]|nr:T9SS type A sorting domain-containing protein [Flavobacteriales bacterium]